jgi:2-succinyl-6-hydroxy-2,4-cyclohexadiene-1-carboxylate synthase
LTRTDPSGPRFLALHGFAGDGTDFARLAEATGGDWRTPDLPGHGNNAEAPLEAFGLKRLADDLLPETEPPTVGLGYSLGGRLLLHLARLRPAAFTALVLVGASPGLRSRGEREQRRAADRHWIELLRDDGIEAFLDRWWRQPLFESLGRAPPERLAALRERRLRNDPEGLVRSLEIHGTGALPPLWEDLREFRMPVLLCVGEEDPKFRRIAGEMAEALPRAETAVIPGAGHSAHWERPLETARAIQRFGLK